MARKSKILMEDSVDKRQVGYFPTPDFVSQYLFDEMMLLNPDGTKVLDPAVGKGELVKSFLDYGKDVEGYDIVDYPNRNDRFNFIHADFIQEFIQKPEQFRIKGYDYIIMNPPYNCHEHSYISTHREILRNSFQTGTGNMFALFLEATIEIAKDGCLIGCIVPDSVLFVSAYENLRRKILTDCEILQIVLCPAYLFRNKGAYVSTCILILRKGKAKNSLIRYMERPSDIATFKSVLKTHKLKEAIVDDLLLRVSNNSTIFTIGCPEEIKKLFTTCDKLGELFKCGGGVSTGNNSLFTSSIQSTDFSIPFLTNISTPFVADTDLFLCKDFLVQAEGNRKFIVRNMDYLHQEGIACSGIGKHFYAAFLPENVVTGVNATIWLEKHDLLWLLAYLNSSLVTYLMKGIIARSHITTIGNVSSLPILNFTASEKKSLDRISKKVLNGKLIAEEAILRIDWIVYKSLNISSETHRVIRHFCADIIHLV